MSRQHFGNRTSMAALALAACLAATGCDDEAKSEAAPSATTLEDTKPAATGATTLQIQTKGSEVGFEMDAPKEKIRGKVEGATKGEIAIDPRDLTKTTGHLYVDLGKLELFQRKASDDGEFGEEEKNETQNEHARAWLEIGPCDDEAVEDQAKCEEMTKKNRNVELVITKVETPQKDLTKLKGNERKVTATVTGDFLLHQKKTEKTAEVAITFEMDGEQVKSVRVETVKPFAVGLAEHEVKPRKAFGILASKTLDVLAPKVAKEALVTLSFRAEAKPAKGPEPAASAERPPAKDAKPATY